MKTPRKFGMFNNGARIDAGDAVAKLTWKRFHNIEKFAAACGNKNDVS